MTSCPRRKYLNESVIRILVSLQALGHAFGTLSSQTVAWPSARLICVVGTSVWPVTGLAQLFKALCLCS